MKKPKFELTKWPPYPCPFKYVFHPSDLEGADGELCREMVHRGDAIVSQPVGRPNSVVPLPDKASGLTNRNK